MSGKLMKRILLVVDRFHWLGLIMTAPFLVLPSPKRSLALLVVPALWILHGCINEKSWSHEQSSVPRPRSSFLTTKILFLSVTPFNAAILLITIMLLVSLWATYDINLSLEKISGLVLGLGVFFAIVRESRKPWGWWWSLAAFLGGGLGWATLGFLGMSYQVRFSFLASVISRVPVIIKGLPGAESGLQHNAVGGTILWFLPVFCLMSVYFLKAGIENGKLKIENWGSGKVWKWIARNRLAAWVVRLGLWLGALFIVGVLILTQSRGSYLALGITVLGLLFFVLPKRRRWILLVLVILSVLVVSIFIVQAGGWEEFIALIGFSGEEGLSVNTLGARLEIWSRAIYGVQDFPFTGLGMNTFREVVHVLYPLFTISPDFDIAHAHNEFLQTALDLGVPGLIAFISIYIVAFWMLLKTWRASIENKTPSIISADQTALVYSQDPTLIKMLVLGLGGGLFGHLIFGLTDAITLGAKPGVFYWMLLGLITGLYQLTEEEVKEVVE